MTETVTHDEPTDQPDHFAEIAAELRRVADDIQTLVGSGLPKPSHVAFDIHAGGPRLNRDDDLTARAVDALGVALLGKPGAAQKMYDDTYHYGTEVAARGLIKVHVYDSVSTAWAVRREAAAVLAEREAELAKLRAEVAALRAAAAPTLVTDAAGLDYTRADTDADDPTPVSPARPPAHWGGMVGPLDGGQLVTVEEIAEGKRVADEVETAALVGEGAVGPHDCTCWATSRNGCPVHADHAANAAGEETGCE